MRKTRKQVFNISVEDYCDDCIYCSYSDLFMGEVLCSNPNDDVILYPEHGGDKSCEYIVKLGNEE